MQNDKVRYILIFVALAAVVYYFSTGEVATAISCAITAILLAIDADQVKDLRGFIDAQADQARKMLEDIRKFRARIKELETENEALRAKRGGA